MRKLALFLVLLAVGCAKPAPVESTAPSPPPNDAGTSPSKPPTHEVSPVEARFIKWMQQHPRRVFGPRAYLAGNRASIHAPQDAGVKKRFTAGYPIVNPATAESDWYVSVTGGGSDNNSCTVSFANACQTFAAIFARLGSYNAIATAPAMTIHVQGDMPSTDPLPPWNPQTQGTTSANLTGSPVTVATGTLAGVVIKNRSGGQELNANLGAAALTYLGLRICVPARTACGYVDKQISGTVMRITQPQLTTTYNNEVDSWANGDSFVISRPPKVYVSSTNNLFVSGIQIMQSGLNQVHIDDTLLFDSIIDPNASVITNNTTVSDVYQVGTIGATFRDTLVLSGAITSVTLDGSSSLGSDVIVYGGTQFNAGGGSPSYDFVFIDSAGILTFSGGGQVFPFQASAFYGKTYEISVVHAFLEYYGQNFPGPPSAASSFLGTGQLLTLFGGTQATACDITKDFELCHPGRLLSIANMDLPYSSGGFQGIALSNDLRSGYENFNNTGGPTTPTQTIIDTLHGGTGLGLDGGCPDGGVLGGIPLACIPQTGTSGPTVTVASGNAGIGVTGGPNYVVSNNDPGANVSVLAGANITSVVHSGESWTVNAATQVGGDAGSPLPPATGTSTVLVNNPNGTAGLFWLGDSLQPTPASGSLFEVVSGAPTWVFPTGSDIVEAPGHPGLRVVAGIQSQPVPPPSGNNTLLTWSPNSTSAFAWSGDALQANPASTSLLELVSGAPTWTLTTGTDLSEAPGHPGLRFVSGIQNNAIPSPVGTNAQLTWNVNGGSTFTWTTSPSQEVSIGGAITPPLTTFITITASVPAGQKAYISMTAWVQNTDNNPHSILMALNNIAMGEVSIPFFTTINGESMMAAQQVDATVGTNTYNLQFSRVDIQPLAGGATDTPRATLRVDVR